MVYTRDEQLVDSDGLIFLKADEGTVWKWLGTEGSLDDIPDEEPPGPAAPGPDTKDSIAPGLAVLLQETYGRPRNTIFAPVHTTEQQLVDRKGNVFLRKDEGTVWKWVQTSGSLDYSDEELESVGPASVQETNEGNTPRRVLLLKEKYGFRSGTIVDTVRTRDGLWHPVDKAERIFLCTDEGIAWRWLDSPSSSNGELRSVGPEPAHDIKEPLWCPTDSLPRRGQMLKDSYGQPKDSMFTIVSTTEQQMVDKKGNIFKRLDEGSVWRWVDTEGSRDCSNGELRTAGPAPVQEIIDGNTPRRVLL
eukprot:CAMPEP_0198206468 /NCGR_PEP_ID=MMETSP1445-20131203/10021_1 /TAXON_ID=36898 /ORGANISM="Pyramimonas sp., Strain CCMP2087" /LENGTH=303 /DNA_ID=CAMNT_0043879181 /DNA_START=30 /DNA_END=938 /DNA_ORIENTATION=-